MPTDGFRELRKIWSNITTEESIADMDFDINTHKKILDIFHVGSYYYLINNVRRSRFELVGPEVETVLGYPQESFDLALFSSLIHPEDLPYFLNFETAVEQFFAKLSGEKLFKYKVQYDHRMRHSDGHYIRMLMQYVIIQHEAQDVCTFVVHTDVSHLKKDPRPVLSFIGMDGEPSYMDVDVKNIFRQGRQTLTSREREILGELVKGRNSTEISEVLNISKHTVDSHRKNMLKKTNAKTTSEIIRIAFDNGWI